RRWPGAAAGPAPCEPEGGFEGRRRQPRGGGDRNEAVADGLRSGPAGRRSGLARVAARLPEITMDAVVNMPDGLPGFDKWRRFVVIPSASFAPFTCLQSLDEPKPSFLTLDPRAIEAGYTQSLSDGDRARLEARDDDAMLWLALVRVDDDAMKVNLRAPVVIN